MGKWIWWRANKRPFSKYTVYLSITYLWVLVGMGALYSFASLMAGAWITAIVFFVAVLAVISSALWVDRKQGYLEVLHNHYLDRRHEKMSKYSLTEEEGK